jgi:hypothetical protein
VLGGPGARTPAAPVRLVRLELKVRLPLPSFPALTLGVSPPGRVGRLVTARSGSRQGAWRRPETRRAPGRPIMCCVVPEGRASRRAGQIGW